jgi:hypothetical protein
LLSQRTAKDGNYGDLGGCESHGEFRKLQHCANTLIGVGNEIVHRVDVVLGAETSGLASGVFQTQWCTNDLANGCH